MVCQGILSPWGGSLMLLPWACVMGKALQVNGKHGFDYCTPLDISITKTKLLSLEEWARRRVGPPGFSSTVTRP